MYNTDVQLFSTLQFLNCFIKPEVTKWFVLSVLLCHKLRCEKSLGICYSVGSLIYRLQNNSVLRCLWSCFIYFYFSFLLIDKAYFRLHCHKILFRNLLLNAVEAEKYIASVLYRSVHSVCLWDEKGAPKVQSALQQDIVDFIRDAQAVCLCFLFFLIKVHF